MKQDKTRSFNMDCLEFMQSVPDKFYDLAIVDPPYGLGKKTTNGGNKKNSMVKFNNHKWDDKIPDNLYFNELFRISKNQIIWGGNYFFLPPNRGFIVWDKMVYIPTMSRIEQAWTSFNYLPVLIQINNTDKNRIHPTQKPVKLYEWILINYAKEGDKILDTHGGSQSSRIACYNLGFEFDIIELDKDYFEAGNKRFDQHKKQLTIF